MSLKIFVHTVGRIDIQYTIARFPEDVLEQTWLVVQETEADEYEYPRLMVLPSEITMLSPTRQYILENAGSEKIVMMDDDLYFYRRKGKNDWHLHYCTPEDFADMFSIIEDWLDDFVHCGISSREGNNHVETLHKDIGRMQRVLAYNVPKVLKVGARFDRIDCKQDFDMTLQLLREGFPNRISYEFAQGQSRGSQFEGGCALYRDKEMMERCAHELHDFHPDFVTVVEKKTKSAWKDFDNVRVDVRIGWKKAFESSQ